MQKPVPIVIFSMLLTAGCGKPSETERDNRRLFDAVLTAVTVKNAAELSQDETLLDGRHAAQELGDAPYQEIKSAIAKAKSGLWQEAESELYKFREENPFPR